MLAWDWEDDHSVHWTSSRQASNWWKFVEWDKAGVLAVAAVEGVVGGILKGTLGDDGLWEVNWVEALA